MSILERIEDNVPGIVIGCAFAAAGALSNQGDQGLAIIAFIVTVGILDIFYVKRNKVGYA